MTVDQVITELTAMRDQINEHRQGHPNGKAMDRRSTALTHAIRTLEKEQQCPNGI